MKIVINPKYIRQKAFIKSIPEIFAIQGTLIYDGRNQLKTYVIDDYEVVVKSFKKPNIVNKIVYGNFRYSKARRSYENALQLIEKGFLTPDPIAYIEEKKCGLFHRSYYISIFEKDFDHIRKQMLGELEGKEFQAELARFIAKLHDSGILNKDLSPGNILTRKEDGNFLFSLVDINRMTFPDKISIKTRYKNFKRISENVEIISFMAREYAKVCALNEEEAVKEINKYCEAFYRK